VIYLITRPVVWGGKIVVWTVKRPAAIVRSRRNRRLRKDVKELQKAQKLG
jgi:uncharacterized membrane protein